MLEIKNFPIQEKFYTANNEFCVFFEGLANHILKNEGIIICGDSEELVDKASKELVYLSYKSLYEYFDRYKEIACRERDPYFLKIFRSNYPEFVILHKDHSRYLFSKTDSEYIEI